MDQKFNFFHIFLSSKFKHNSRRMNVKKKIHYNSYKPFIFQIKIWACTKTCPEYLKTWVGFKELCIKTWADYPIFRIMCPCFGTDFNQKGCIFPKIEGISELVPPLLVFMSPSLFSGFHILIYGSAPNWNMKLNVNLSLKCVRICP